MSVEPAHRRLSQGDRQILQLALPAFLTLVSEPLFLLADAAIVGHLGTVPLAGLALAGTILTTVVGLCVFLAYTTTGAVARQRGAGDPAAAVRLGLHAIWLALLLGVAITGLGLLLSEEAVSLFHVESGVNDAALSYLRPAWLGVTPLLIALAATGVLRGLFDTRTPLVVSVLANLANVALNLALVYGLDLGLRGAAWGTVGAQLAAAIALTSAVMRRARPLGASLRFDPHGVRGAARAGGPLFVRTLTLRLSLLLMTWCAASLGTVPLAAHQLALALWTFLAFALDALAIAAQALTGAALGAGDVAATRRTARRINGWGIAFGVLTGVGLAVSAPLVGHLFTRDPQVVTTLSHVLWVAALLQPLAAVVFVWDGILIGAGDARYLAAASALVFVVFAPLALAAVRLPLSSTEALVALWLAFGVGFIGTRAATLLVRARGSAWIVTGAPSAR